MIPKNGNKDKRSIRQMFARLAPRYDFVNRIITIGQDHIWRRQTIDQLELDEHGRILDLGTGTGKLAFEILRRTPDVKIIAVDFTPQMIRIGQQLDLHHEISWIIADASQLPFVDAAFDAAVSGFVLRNVSDIDSVLEEQNRILKSHGRIACLETSPPTRRFASRLIAAYMRFIMPILGCLLSGDFKAYHYLQHSTHTFLSTNTLQQRFRSAQFDKVRFSHHMFGNIAIHWAQKAR